MTYEEIFNRTKELISAYGTEGLEKSAHIAVEVDIIGEGEGAFYIEIKDGCIRAEPYEYYDYDCKLIVSGDDYLKMCDGSLDSVKAFMTGKLKIKGDLGKAIEYNKLVETARKRHKKARL